MERHLTKTSNTKIRHMSVFYGFLAFWLFAGILANSRVRRDDDCPEIKTASNFKQTKYMGRWYEYGNYDEISAFNYQCNMFDWTVITNGNFSVMNTIVVQEREKDRPSKVIGRYIAHAPDLSKPERFSMRAPEIPSIPEWDYWILGTDYTSYAVGYRCGDGEKTAWISTRERNPSKSVIGEALKIGEKYGFRMSLFTKVNQSGCDTMKSPINNNTAQKLLINCVNK